MFGGWLAIVHNYQGERITTQEAIITHNPYVLELRELILESSHLGVSDIYISAEDDHQISYRHRLNGSIKRVRVFGKREFENIRRSVFRLCKINPLNRDDTQDPKFTLDQFDYRVNYIRNIYGFKVVLRVIARGKGFNLNTYPMPENEKAKLKNLLMQKQGIILVTGPTNSGKSNLLYSGISYVNDPSISIVSIESPVEYRIDGVDQIEIVEDEKLTFPRAVRACLRQAPDIILIGEIRDKETAEAAFRLAQTGHLVLSTLHTNCADGVSERLSGFGVSKELVAALLLYVSNQRLVKVLCECKEYDGDSSSKYNSQFSRDDPVKTYKPSKKGCAKCHYTGYIGRSLVMESIKYKNGIVDQRTANLLDQVKPLVEIGRVHANEAIGLLGLY